MIRMRHMARIGPSPNEITGLQPDDEVTFAPMDALADGLGGLDTTHTRPLGELISGSYNYFAECDILLAKVTPCFENGKKAIAAGLANGVGFATSEVHVIRPDTRRLDPSYLRYLLSGDDFRAEGMRSMTGAGGLRRVSERAILDFRPAVTDLDTQKAIAAFLDAETARIDALIEKKGRLQELTREKETATLERAVKGQDRGGPVRESGAEWIGSIPEHWLAPKFTQVARLESGHTPSRQHPEYWVSEECTVPWVSLADIWQVRREGRIYLSETAEKVSPLGLANSAARLLPSDTVMLSRTASVGFPAIMAVPMATTQDFVNWICGPKILPEYLYLVLKSMRREFARLMMGSTHQTIYMPDVRSFKTPLPPLEEQREIVRRLWSKLDDFRELTAKVQDSIEGLREFRAALITAAVTGQIDPAGWRRRGEGDRRLDDIESEMTP